jgi:hypothetical protein
MNRQEILRNMKTQKDFYSELCSRHSKRLNTINLRMRQNMFSYACFEILEYLISNTETETISIEDIIKYLEVLETEKHAEFETQDTELKQKIINGEE